jgi:hypothetical protein
MKFILISLIITKISGFTTLLKPVLQKPINTLKYSLYEVGPINTIIYYNLDGNQKTNIKNEIDENRFTMNSDQIYISLHDVKESNEVITKLEIFLYVHDKLNNMNGQYILQSKNYKKFDKSIICSFYESNPTFFCNLSYYQYNLDNVNFNTDLLFDFIYQNSTNTFLINIGTSNKVSYIPTYLYTSEFKYKKMHWKKSDKVIYYKTSFYYK